MTEINVSSMAAGNAPLSTTTCVNEMCDVCACVIYVCDMCVCVCVR